MCTEQDFFNIKRPRVVSKLESTPYTKGENNYSMGKIHRARFSFDIQHLLDYTSLDRLTLLYSHHPWLFHERIFTSHMVGSNYHVHIVLGVF